MYSKSKGYITHVGYLWKPVDPAKPNGDYWVIEARGVMHGVVATKLSARGWNRWGKMHKRYDYHNNLVLPENDKDVDAVEFGTRLLKKGCEGKDVKLLQETLIDFGFSCGRYGADGEFGNATKDAVEAFQELHGLEVDGIVGPKTIEKIMSLIEDESDPVTEQMKKIRVTGNTVNIRDLPSVENGRIMKVAKKGELYDATGNIDGKWHEIYVNDEKGWISNTYAEVAE